MASPEDTRNQGGRKAVHARGGTRFWLALAVGTTAAAAALAFFGLRPVEVPVLPPVPAPEARGIAPATSGLAKPPTVASRGPATVGTLPKAAPARVSERPAWAPAFDQTEEEAFAEQVRELEDVRERLRSPDPQVRLDAIDELRELDPVVAGRDLDNLLRGAETDEEVRLKAFEELTDLATYGEVDASAVQVLVRGLQDPSSQVREQAAWLLRFEDGDSDPRIVTALREAYAKESDPDVRDSIEQALELADRDFQPDLDS